MKRLIAGGLLLLIAAIAVFLWRQNQMPVSSSQLAPADCLVYIELPNLIQTAKRWPETALCQILGEPSVQRFLRQPVSKIPKSYQSVCASVQTLRCSALFFGITDPNGQSWICGFQTSADQRVWRREISNISAVLFGQAVHVMEPADYQQPGPRQSEGGRNGAFTYCAQFGSWILLSRTADLLMEASRNAKAASGGLQSVNLFQECRANVKEGYDILCFVRGRPSIDLSRGLRWRFREDESQDTPRAMLATTAIDGTQLRDTVFTLTDKPAPVAPLDRKGLAMTSPTTIGYLASRVNLSEIWRRCDELSRDWPIAKTIRDYLGEVKSFGIEMHELDALLSYIEIVIDRDPQADSLNAAFSAEITDPEKFQHFIDQIVMEKFPDRSRRIEVASVPAYVIQLNGNTPLICGLVGRQLLVALTRSEFAELVHRLQSHSAGLENNAQFKGITKLVHEPADLVVYLDAKAAFDSLYEAFRPMLVFGVALIPALNQYIDAMTFPETGEVSKHLSSPIVLSQYRVAHGVVDESVGPITAYDAFALISGGAVAMGLLGH
ncbi:MAG TPA: hypothetical protein VGF37_00790 [Chthoniobacterales bacterium]